MRFKGVRAPLGLKRAISTWFWSESLHMKYFLGMEVARSKKGVPLSQRKYTMDLLHEIGMLCCKPIETPIEQGGKRKLFDGDPVDKERYQRLVGKLIYLSHTQLDIAFAVSVVSQYMHSPCQRHFDVVY